MLTGVVFLAVTSGTMVNVALPVVGDHFSATEGTYSWVVTGYTLTFGIFAAIHGRLADNLGLRRLYLLGLASFASLALVVSVAPRIDIMIALRLLQGAGAAAMPALGTAIISRVFPASRRGQAMGFILGTVGVAATIGPFLGGALAQWVSWRAVFLFPALGLCLLPIGFRVLPRSLDDVHPRPFDMIGALLLSVSCALLMYTPEAIKSYGNTSWTWLIACTGLVLLVAFGLWVRWYSSPFLPPVLFQNPRYLLNASLAFMCQATRFGSIILVPIVLINVNHIAPLTVGAVLAPGAIAIALLSPKMGSWSDASGPRNAVVTGIVCMIAGNLVTAAFVGASPWGVALGMTLYGCGFAGVQSPLTSSVSRFIPGELIGVGMGFFMMIFFLGGAFGVAVSVTVLEWHAVDAHSWVGLSLGEGNRFSNAILSLTGLALIGLVMSLFLPSTPPAQSTSTATQVP